MFKRWLSRKLHDILYSNELGCEPTNLTGTVTRLDYHHEGVLNIRVFGATGGTVVEVGRYDKKLDQNKTGVYVIPDTTDFSDELSKIITMEQLKHF